MLCDKLQQLFGNEYSFAPAKVSEGGIEFTNWPYKDQCPEISSKCIRFQGNHGSFKWPFIKNDQLTLWRNSEPVQLIKSDKNKLIIRLNSLKAFHGSPVWTLEEINLFVLAFESIGFKIKGRLPPKKCLKEYGRLGSHTLGHNIN